eukprot:4244189-Prymnesium_polylepis.1
MPTQPSHEKGLGRLQAPTRTGRPSFSIADSERGHSLPAPCHVALPQNIENIPESMCLDCSMSPFPELMDPPAGAICTDANGENLVEGAIVRVIATGTLFRVTSVVYIGFSRVSTSYARPCDPGFMLDTKSGLVNAPDCVKVDLSNGVWLEHEESEYGLNVDAVPEGLEKGRFYFANNHKMYEDYCSTYRLTLWNNGLVDRSAEKPCRNTAPFSRKSHPTSRKRNANPSANAGACPSVPWTWTTGPYI